MSRVAIVGGGITGLTLAYELEKSPGTEVVLFEASDRLGGKIETLREEGKVIEQGPDCFFTGKPAARELVSELGIENELVEPRRSQFCLYIEGSLHEVPRGLMSFTHIDPEAVRSVAFLSDDSKRAVLEEASAPESMAADESLAEFFRRRFGEGFSTMLAETLLAGTHGGDPEKLSVRALYPGYWKLEKVHGSLSAAPKPPDEKGPMFQSFREGMQTLTDALQQSLQRTEVRLGTPVRGVGRNGSVTTAGGEERFDHVAVVTPSWAAVDIVSAANPRASELMAKILFADAAIVTFVIGADQVEERLQGTGFLVPKGALRPVTGATFSSEKWEGRCDDDTAIIRAFLGRDGWLELRDMSDDDCVRAAKVALSKALGAELVPLSSQVVRMPDALPQYQVGHVELVDRIEQALESTPAISVCGTSYRGIGIPDCITNARKHAQKLTNQLEESYV
ncbi:MAG: protoporphyrinogen oxidase [Armatimonadetes bacterium]|nr:protoporphyrinogen oxidase [Armatimonadota bacterium]